MPYIGKKLRPEAENVIDSTTEDSSTSSDEEENVTTAIVGQSKDRIVLRTNRWFQDWCKDPTCEQEAQHRHKYFNPNGLEKGEYTESVWSICHSKDCRVSPNPHAHQKCMIRNKQTLPLSYFKRLPRQDTPEVERHAKGLDAIDEAISDYELDSTSKNDKAVARRDN